MILQKRDREITKEEELADILEQIRNYPTPISMCDEQFDDLLRERDRLWSTEL